MHQDMINAGNHAVLGPEPETHVNITDLRHRGKRDHSPDILFSDGADGTEDHAAQSEYKKYINDMATVNDIQSDDPVKNLDQQENIAFDTRADSIAAEETVEYP